VRDFFLLHFYCTVRFAIPATPFTLAEIIVVPAFTPLASPRELTIETAGVEEFHVTWPELIIARFISPCENKSCVK